MSTNILDYQAQTLYPTGGKKLEELVSELHKHSGYLVKSILNLDRDSHRKLPQTEVQSVFRKVIEAGIITQVGHRSYTSDDMDFALRQASAQKEITESECSLARLALSSYVTDLSFPLYINYLAHTKLIQVQPFGVFRFERQLYGPDDLFRYYGISCNFHDLIEFYVYWNYRLYPEKLTLVTIEDLTPEHKRKAIKED